MEAICVLLDITSYVLSTFLCIFQMQISINYVLLINLYYWTYI